MERKPFQYSLFSLLALTTICAVVLSFGKTFPNAALQAGVMAIGLLLMTTGDLLSFDPPRFLRNSPRLIRLCTYGVGLLFIACGLLFLLACIASIR